MLSQRSAYQPLRPSRLRLADDRRLEELLQSLSSETISYALPTQQVTFTGRQAEMTQAFAQWRHLSQPKHDVAKVLSIVGEAGVGKSSFALQFAHQLPQFDTQVYLDLTSISTPLSAAAVAQQVQVALGMNELGAVDRPVLLLLDAVDHASQLEPLLGLKQNCTILATSRRSLDLPTIATLELQRLTADDAIALLATSRLSIDWDTSLEIIDCCDALPLALDLVVGWLQQPSPVPFAEKLTQLRHERQRCDRLQLSHPAIRTGFNLIYQTLEPAAARLLRLLGLLSVSSLSVKTAIGLSELSSEAARTCLSQLMQARLLESKASRYELPSALRVFVKTRLASETDLPVRAAARQRLHQSYLDSLEVMHLGLDASSRSQIAQRYSATRSSAAFSQKLFATALSWFTVERASLFAALAAAAESEDGATVLLIVRYFMPYLQLRSDDWDLQTIGQSLKAVLQQVNSAPTADQERLEAAKALSNLGNLYLQRQNWEKAKQQYEQSLKFLTDRDPLQTAQTLVNLGLIQIEANDRPGAAARWTDAIKLLSTNPAAQRELVDWMQTTDAALFQEISFQIGDQLSSRTFFGELGDRLRRWISDPAAE